MSSRIRLIFLIAGLAFFCYLVMDFGLGNIVSNLIKTGWWFGPIIGIWGVVYLFNALAWRVIMGESGRDIGFREIVNLTLSSSAINYATPLMGLGGEPLKVLAVEKRVGVGSAVSSVFLYRLIHAIAHIIFLIVILLLAAVLIPLSSQLRLFLVSTAIGLLVLAYLLLSVQRRTVFSSAINLIRKIPYSGGLKLSLDNGQKLADDIDCKIRDFYRSRKGAFYLALFWEMLARIVSSYEFYFILHAVGSEISWFDAFYIGAVSSFILNLFFFIPFELGTREGSLFLIMGSLKLTPEIGIFVGLTNRIREMFWIIVGLGLIYLSGRRVHPLQPIVTIEEDISVVEEKL
jgi:uncharacterized protein (TIRG00374 family)